MSNVTNSVQKITLVLKDAEIDALKRALDEFIAKADDQCDFDDVYNACWVRNVVDYELFANTKRSK